MKRVVFKPGTIVKICEEIRMRFNREVTKIVMNPTDYADIRIFDKETFNLEMNDTRHHNGIMGMLFGTITIQIDKSLPEDRLKILTMNFNDERWFLYHYPKWVAPHVVSGSICDNDVCKVAEVMNS